MSIELEPSELEFQRPFTREVTQTLHIKNTNYEPIAFKVKTTAPKQYCVRPNSGRIEPGQDVEVSVLLQAMKQDPPMDAKCRDKFLVQSVPISADHEFVDAHNIWDGIAKTDIQEKKIRVVFLPAQGQPMAPSAVTPLRNSVVNGLETPDAPPAYSSPRESDAVSSITPAASESSPDTKRETKSEPNEKPVIASLKEAPIETLKAQLAAAEAKIVQLTAKADSGLRQRKGVTVGGGDGSSGELQQAVRQATEGVPVRTVAILCIICFLLGYLFF